MHGEARQKLKVQSIGRAARGEIRIDAGKLLPNSRWPQGRSDINAANGAGDRAYRIRVDRLCVSTKRFNTRRVTDSSRRRSGGRMAACVASTCSAGRVHLGCV